LRTKSLSLNKEHSSEPVFLIVKLSSDDINHINFELFGRLFKFVFTINIESWHLQLSNHASKLKQKYNCVWRSEIYDDRNYKQGGNKLRTYRLFKDIITSYLICSMILMI
jgi:hypothetical protein